MTTINTLTSGESGASSLTDINTNFANLNAGKPERAVTPTTGDFKQFDGSGDDHDYGYSPDSFSKLKPTGATYTPATGAQTVALDCATNNMHIVTGHASGTAITFTVANAANNQPFVVSILQGAVVSTISGWFATVRWAGGSAPTLTATINKRDTFGFIRTGASTYD